MYKPIKKPSNARRKALKIILYAVGVFEDNAEWDLLAKSLGVTEEEEWKEVMEELRLVKRILELKSQGRQSRRL